jgi:8-oxo-dGTP pyrophosphatase MutT (NUDIX family)
MSHLIKAAVVIQHNDRFLLVQEKGRVYGLWNWPQGRVEEGETSEQAALREAAEETGLDIALERKIAVLENTFPDTKEIHVYLGKAVGGELRFPENEILDARYFTSGEVESMKDQLVGEWIFETIKRTMALRSGDFGLDPPTDTMLPTGDGHSGVCGKRYATQF